MVHVVAALPPSNGQATAKVGNEDADEGVYLKNVSDGSVTGIVRREHDLMLVHSVSQCCHSLSLSLFL